MKVMPADQRIRRIEVNYDLAQDAVSKSFDERTDGLTLAEAGEIYNGLRKTMKHLERMRHWLNSLANAKEYTLGYSEPTEPGSASWEAVQDEKH